MNAAYVRVEIDAKVSAHLPSDDGPYLRRDITVNFREDFRTSEKLREAIDKFAATILEAAERPSEAA